MTVRVIEPDPINFNELVEVVDAGLLGTGELVKVNYALSTGTWEQENVPKFKEEGPKTSGGDRVWIYKTKDTPFVFVDQGTDGPYPIPKVPKTSGFLAFQSGFIPKTKPGKLVAGPGARFGPTRFAKQVMHPGIEERDMTGEVADRAEEDFPIQMDLAHKNARSF